MPIDPQAAAYYARQSSAAGTAGAATIEAVRENADKRYNDKRKYPPVYSVEDVTVPGPGGGLPMRIYTPGGAGPYPVLVYYHGGGFIMHNIASHDALCRRLCNVCGCAVVNVGYRLAPENPYPACMEDGYTALQWVRDNGGLWGLDGERIAVMGDSAGASISAVMCLLCRDRRGPKVSLQVLCYGAFGVLGAEQSESMRAFSGGDYVLSGEFMAMSRRFYTAGRAREDDPYLDPGRAADLTGLPKSVVITAEYDPLRDDGEAYARRLEQAGNDVTLCRVPGLMHGFLLLWEEVDRAGQVIDDVGRIVRQTFGL